MSYKEIHEAWKKKRKKERDRKSMERKKLRSELYEQATLSALGTGRPSKKRKKHLIDQLLHFVFPFKYIAFS